MITSEEIKHFSSVYEVETYARGKRMPYPNYVSKPSKLPRGHSAKEALEYAQKLAEYEELEKEHDIKVREASIYNSTIDAVIVEWMKENSGLNDIPEQYRSKVYSLAYERGHSSGHSEVMSNLIDLVHIFE
jgi:hypothetical protein